MKRRLLIVVMEVLLASVGVKAQPTGDGGLNPHEIQSLKTMVEGSYDYFFLEAMVQRQKGHDDAAFDLLRHCVELRPDAAEAYYFLAQYYGAMKHADKSHECVAKAAHLEPENTTFMETLAQSYIRREDYASAAEVVERLYGRNKDRLDLLEMLYSLYIQQKDYDRAVDVLNRLEAADGMSEQLTYAKCGIYMRQEQYDKATEALKQLADQYPNDLNYQCQYADQLLTEANINEDPKQKQAAVDIYQQILSQEPDNVRAQSSMESYLRLEGDTLAADRLALQILLNHNTTTEQKSLMLRKAIQRSEEQGGDSTKILDTFRLLLAQPEPDVDIAALYAAYMDLKNMPADSIKPVLERILQIQPDNMAARLQLVSYAWSENDRDRVIELCQAARQYNPDEMAFYYYQGMAYYQNDDPDAALGAFRNGVGVINEQSNPALVSDFYAVMGDLLHQKGLAREAFEAYDSCLQWKDDNIMCLNNYAYYLSELGQQLDRAEQMSYKTVKAEPKNATYLDTYAWILFMQKRYAEARIYIEQALQNTEDSADNSVILEHAGDIYIQNGNVDQALQMWQEAQLTRPNDKTLTRKIKQKKYITK